MTPPDAPAAPIAARSLAESHASVMVPRAGFWRRLAAFVGPGYLVAVGYMDPGNWATDIAGGSAFGYTLLIVVLLSNVMAMLLQALAAVLTAQDRHDAAFDELTAAERDDVGIITDLRISSLRQARRFEEAESLALDAVRRRPDIVRHHLELAQVHSDRGRHTEAESVLRDALHRFPRDPDILQALLHLHRWLGRYEDALGESQCLLESSPRSVTFLLQHADLLDDLDRQGARCHTVTRSDGQLHGCSPLNPS